MQRWIPPVRTSHRTAKNPSSSRNFLPISSKIDVPVCAIVFWIFVEEFMGITYVSALAIGTRGRRREVKFLVDSGAGYSLLPTDVWHELGLKALREVSVDLADGTRLPRAVSECRIRIQGVEAASPVILGEPGDEALLGAVTLENLGFVLNPLKRVLQPMQVRG